jgi:alcohol dehydrogenase
MKALVYQATDKKSLEQRPKPEIATPADAIVRMTKTTICGTDLHILKGDVPTCQPGRIGLAALLTAQFYAPAEVFVLDLDDNRLELAKAFGATSVFNNRDGKAVDAIMKLTGGRGVDTAIEAVGIPATFECARTW